MTEVFVEQPLASPGSANKGGGGVSKASSIFQFLTGHILGKGVGALWVIYWLLPIPRKNLTFH